MCWWRQGERRSPAPACVCADTSIDDQGERRAPAARAAMSVEDRARGLELAEASSSRSDRERHRLNRDGACAARRHVMEYVYNGAFSSLLFAPRRPVLEFPQELDLPRMAPITLDQYGV